MRKTIIVVILFLNSLGCLIEKTDVKGNQQKKVVYLSEDQAQEVVESIRELLEEIVNDSLIKKSSLDTLTALFEKNEFIKIGKNSFPQGVVDSKLLYDSTDRLLKLVDSKNECLVYLLTISLKITRIAEFSEYISQKIPVIALGNTLEFVRYYDSCSTKYRNFLLNDLENFKTKDQLEQFISNLDEIGERALHIASQDLKHKLLKRFR